jgi:hypothetical protein
MTKRTLLGCCFALLVVPALCLAANDLLLGEKDLAAKIEKDTNYQLLDARSAEAQRIAPIAFSTKYQTIMPIRNGLVLIVADTDAAALKIAKSIPAEADRTVFAVKGGAEAWQRVSSNASPPSTMSDSYVIPMNTCEPGKPLQVLKRNKPRQKAKSK